MEQQLGAYTMQSAVVQKTHSGRNMITSRTLQSPMQWWFLPVFGLSLRLHHQTAWQRPCGMCTYTAATLGGVLVNISICFVDRAPAPGRNYIAPPASPGMRRRCHPTFSLQPRQAKSGMDAQEEARGSRPRGLAEPKLSARQACNGGLD